MQKGWGPLTSLIKVLFIVEPYLHFVVTVLGDRTSQECEFKGIWTFAKETFIIGFNAVSFKFLLGY